AVSAHWGVWSADPAGYNAEGIFTALPAAGIVFSFLGFRTAIDLGGESANPGRNIPIAVIGSVVLSTIVYVLLQVGFLMALRPSDLSGGWGHLSFSGEAGPFAGLAASLGIGWLATILYADAYVSPGGTGLIYVTGGSRILYAVGEMKAGPRWLTLLNKADVPWAAVAVMWVIGVIFLMPFPAWQLLVGYITSITVLTYGLGPIVLMVLRRSQPDLPRPFRLAGAGVIAPIAFISSNLVIYWTGFVTNSYLFVLIAVGFAIYAIYFHFVTKKPAADFGWSHIAWLLAWFGGMWILSALGSVGGGFAVLGFWTGVVLVMIWSLIVMWLALRAALPAEATARLMNRMESSF
ncbi:APC family permease, partial [Thioclava sp. BHET1]